MTGLSKEELSKVLTKHGYKVPPVMTPEWCQFALQLVQAELLQKIERQGKAGVPLD